MELSIIPKQDMIPAFNSEAIKVRIVEADDDLGNFDEITEESIASILSEIPKGIAVALYLDPNGDTDWLEVQSDGKWLSLVFYSDDEYTIYNPKFAGKPDLTTLESGGQSHIEKVFAIQDMEIGIKAVEYFIRTGELYPGIDWAKYL